MKRFLSAAGLVLLVSLALLGPRFLGLKDDVQAPPYSKPDWLDRAIAPTRVLRLSSDSEEGPGGLSIRWDYATPLGVSFTGHLDPGGALRWTTPERDFLLADLVYVLVDPRVRRGGTN
jgi:hypothetical protein